MSIVIFGGTFDMPHLGHKTSYEWLINQGHNVFVVPAIAHEFKPHVLPSYLHRRNMAELTFGDGVQGLEELALLNNRLPIRAIDVLRVMRTIQKTTDYQNDNILFAIGPDIKVETWSGVEDIYKEGFDFIRMPEVARTLRSTQIRERVARGEEWESFVVLEVAAYIKLHGLYGYSNQ